MAWSKENFLEMLQANSRIYGVEILEIQGASDKWLINHFWERLCFFLDYRAKIASKKFNVKTTGNGVIEEIWSKCPDELTVEKCVEIGNHILRGVVAFSYYNKHQPTINKWDSKIILDYVFEGKPLDRDLRELD